MATDGVGHNEGLLQCMNCKEYVKSDEVQLFMKAFSCKRCFGYATRLRERLLQQLKQLFTVVDESLRVAFVEGKLHPGASVAKEDISKSELLHAVADLVEKGGARAGAVRSDSLSKPQLTSGDSPPVRTDSDVGVDGKKA